MMYEEQELVEKLNKMSIMLGICYGLLSNFAHELHGESEKMFDKITAFINEEFYGDKKEIIK